MTSSRVGGYDVRQRFGESRFAESFLGDAGGGQVAVLKRVKADLLEDRRLVERLRVQGVSPPKIEHPAIAAVRSIVWERDECWLICEHSAGENLSAHKRHRPERADHVMARFCEMLDAVEYAHRHGFVHLGIKPSNICVSPSGTYRLLDFPMARIFGLSPRTRDLFGAPPFRAPELSEGEADPRSDIFSLGAVLRFVLEGLRYPSGVEEAIAKATARDPAHRYSGVAGFREALAGFARPAIAPRPAPLPPAPPMPPPTPKPASRRPFFRGAIAIAGSATVLVAGIAAWNWQTDVSATSKVNPVAAPAEPPASRPPIVKPLPAQPRKERPRPEQTREQRPREERRPEAKPDPPATSVRAPKAFVWREPAKAPETASLAPDHAPPQIASAALPPSAAPIPRTAIAGPPPEPVAPVAPATPTPTPPPAVAPPRPNTEPVLTTSQPPRYPIAARQMRLSGTVKLEVLVGVDGRVKNAKPIRGHALLADAAAAAVRNWTYRPAIRNGQAVETAVQVDIVFRAPESK